MPNKQTFLYGAIFVLLLICWYVGKIFLFPPQAPVAKTNTDNKTPIVEITSKHYAAGATLGAGADFMPEPPPEFKHPAAAATLGSVATVAEVADILRPPPPVKVAVGGGGKSDALKAVLGGPAALVFRRVTITLGSADPNSTYHVQVILDSRGAGVRYVLLNKFQAVDATGQPEFETDESGKPLYDDPEKKIRKKKRLALVPEDRYDALSNLLYHFGTADKESEEERPYDTLGRMEWSIAKQETEHTEDGRELKRVEFRTQMDGVVIAKTYSLAEGEYHIGLAVKMWRADPNDKRSEWFRYQLTGAHGLPIEGQWYTSKFRDAFIAQVDKSNNNSVYRDLQTAQQINLKAGGDEVKLRDPGHFIRYAAVGVQYFASAIVVDDSVDKDKQYFLSKARPTLETGAVKGTLKSVKPDASSFVLGVSDREETYFVDDPDLRAKLATGLIRINEPLGVVHHTDARMRQVAFILRAGSDAVKTQPLWENDITVRVATEPINLKDAVSEDTAVVHKYLLYNGPMKPMLLGHMAEPAKVSSELVTRYKEKLNLNTLVDYPTPGIMGSIGSITYFSYLLIFMTNIMHYVLGFLSNFLPYPLCIIVLTIMVRGMMFPVSRKAAMTSIRMQELQPEINKLKEKYKDDKQGLNMAVWALQRKSGVNPFSTCWMMFLQMPVFMGLYYSLQESIFFRAADFWPTWIHNLAAPDMLFYWGESIPVISSPDWYGTLIYLGPYFNILPVIAVTLMIFQQKMTMPPPTDEQQEMQQKMMKYMMMFMGVMFYRVPSGLVLYFIASSLWGFAERKLLPKKKKPTTDVDVSERAPKAGFFHKMINNVMGKPAETTPALMGGTSAIVPTVANGATTGIVKTEGKGRNRGKQGRGKRRSPPGGESGKDASSENGSMFQRIRNWWRQRKERMNDWWEKLREEAQKKNR